MLLLAQRLIFDQKYKEDKQNNLDTTTKLLVLGFGRPIVSDGTVVLIINYSTQ